ncbi:MAG: DUF4013 domain-containing protein [Planctomycetes bacterium]|nr:DUF4013 domain-containing protein [Planctomycetota bacterium]
MNSRVRVAGLIALLDPQWRAKIFRGGLVLLIPIIGWPAVMGYRARFVRHLFANEPTPLPEWRGEFRRHFVEGLRAMGVVFGYLAPLYVALFALVTSRGFVPDSSTLAWTAGFVAIPILSTLSFPTACVLLAMAIERWISPVEAIAFIAAFAAVVFVIPAGFCQVSRTGRYRDAFALGAALRLIARHPRTYLAAWWHSSVMSLAGHFALSLAPWGVVWCYLGILVLFNAILLDDGAVPRQGWLQRALDDPRLARTAGVAVRDANGEVVRVIELGEYAAPLPRWVG